MVYFIYTHNKQTIFKLCKTGVSPELFMQQVNNFFPTLSFLSILRYLSMQGFNEDSIPVEVSTGQSVRVYDIIYPPPLL